MKKNNMKALAIATILSSASIAGIIHLSKNKETRDKLKSKVKSLAKMTYDKLDDAS